MQALLSSGVNCAVLVTMSFFARMRAAYQSPRVQAIKLEETRAAQYKIFLDCRQEGRRMRTAIEVAREGNVDAALIADFERMASDWERMAAEAQEHLTILNEERDRFHSDQRALMSNWLSVLSLVVSAISLVTSIVALTK